ncbi:MAG: hypothetical protein ACOX7D_03175 [Alphaproteobacteria bacterium]|jgi:hypothetical protein
MPDKTYEQTYYLIKKKNKEWTLDDLKNAVIKADDINKYYSEDKDGKAWLFTNTTDDKIYDDEVWKACKSENYTNIEASNYGRIKIDGKICPPYDSELFKQDTPINKEIFKCMSEECKKYVGNLKVLASKPPVHQLVADAWFPNYTIKNGNKVEIHHITNDGYDNRPKNLICLPGNEHRSMPTQNNGQPCENYNPFKIQFKNE